MTTPQQSAREALRERQGPGARYDADEAPHRDLNLARRGTAYFARMLNNLTDDTLWQPSAIGGRNRRWVTAAICLQARLFADAVAFSRQYPGMELPFPLAIDADEIALAATLPAQALRNLFAHSEVHLNVEWRDLTEDGWARTIVDAQGRRLPVASTPAIRACRIWDYALKLDAGGRRRDVPTTMAVTGSIAGDPLSFVGE